MHSSRTLRPERIVGLLAVTVALAVARGVAQDVSGPDVWAANCGSCHRIRALDTYSAAQWNTIATHMALVARLTPAEGRAVREFLVSSAQSRQAAQTVRELVPQLGGTGTAHPVGGANAVQLQGAQGANSRLVTGRDVYRARCAACHGPEGRGNGPAAAAMNPRPTDFAVVAQRQATTDSSVADVIEHGRRSMPAFGRMLTRVQMDSLVGYVKTLRR